MLQKRQQSIIKSNRRGITITQELARQREHRSALASRQNVLKDLQAKREGVSQAAREVLKARDAGNGLAYVQAIVADVLSTQYENATVIEAALGDLQSALLVSDMQAVVTDSARFGKSLAGRVTVLGLDSIPAFQDGYDWSRHEKKVTRATDVVSFTSTIRARWYISYWVRH